jgi:hypothetical protein
MSTDLDTLNGWFTHYIVGVTGEASVSPGRELLDNCTLNTNSGCLFRELLNDEVDNFVFWLFYSRRF